MKDGRNFHGNEAREKNIIIFSAYFFILIIIKLYNETSGLTNDQKFFDQHLPLKLKVRPFWKAKMTLF